MLKNKISPLKTQKYQKVNIHLRIIEAFKVHWSGAYLYPLKKFSADLEELEHKKRKSCENVNIIEISDF